MEIKELIKEKLVTWSSAVELHNSGRYREALEYYSKIDILSARMRYNMSCAQIKLGDESDAITNLTMAIKQDKHLAVAYFQRGTLFLQHNRIDESISDLEMTRDLLRGNTFIDYKPLGLLVRLTSFQINNNLALAKIKSGRLSDARTILMDALHDADDLQKNVINTSLGRIDDGSANKIQTTHASTDRVFAPPKSVRRNIEKRGIVRKAKVVSAANADDRNAAFEGSKRVRELKLNLTTSDNSFNPLKRFVKTSSPRSPPVFKGMKSSKSMSDLQADDSSVLTGSSSPVVKIKRLFQKRTSDSVDSLSIPQIRLNRSCGDLEKQLSPDEIRSNATKSFPRSPFLGVKKLLHVKKKVCDRLKSRDEQLPVIEMRGSGSMGDLRQPNDQNGRSKSEQDHIQNASRNSTSYEKLNFSSDGHRHSLGSVFGNYLTIINQTLSRSCDVLTAVVTPTEYENDVFISEPIQNHSDTSDESEFDTNAHFYINVEEDDVRETNDVTFSRINLQEELKTHISATRKSRPPPPSYPPPPLPTCVLKV